MKLRFEIGVILLLTGLIFSQPVLTRAQRQRPPEYGEIVQASRIEDPLAKIKALEEIKQKYPNSVMMNSIDYLLVSAKIETKNSIGEIVKLQKDFLDKSAGPGLITDYLTTNDQILNHKKVAKFNKKKIIETVKRYSAIGKKNATDAKILDQVPQQYRERYRALSSIFDIQTATAYILAKNATQAAKYLNIFTREGGTKDGEYFYRLGQVSELKGQKQKAFDNFIRAAGLEYKGADTKAKAFYKKLHGSTKGFNEMLEKKLSELPFEPKHFTAKTKWQGKTALVELFTGSECPPCIAADLGFDGLMESFPGKYLVVLEYHLPIPRPDPMMNPATEKRAVYYGARSTPTTLFDGVNKLGGGGGKGNAENKYNEYAAEIERIIGNAPQVKLKVNARLANDVVKVTWSADKKLPDTEYNFALVQKQEKYTGGNGLRLHKMVVRDFTTLDTPMRKTVSFNLAQSEKATEKYLRDFENQRGFKFEAIHNKIDRAHLKVAFFVQDKNTKAVLNAAICDVKK